MKFSFPLLASTVLFLSACSTPSHTLFFTPSSPITGTSFNTMNQKAIVNVLTQDMRIKSEVSSYTSNGSLVKLSASPRVDQIFQQVMLQNLNAKGFRLANQGSNTKVILSIKDFYANVEEGNLRHKISSKIQLEVQVIGSKGAFTKNIGASRMDEGVLGVNNQDIQKSLDLTLKDVVSSLYKDREIAEAIHRYL